MMSTQIYKIVCSVQLNRLKKLILTSTNILDMVLDLIEEESFHFLVVDLVAM